MNRILDPLAGIDPCVCIGILEPPSILAGGAVDWPVER